MRLTYDVAADAAYIYLREIEAGGVRFNVSVDASEDVASDVNLHFDADGRLIGIEVIGATRGLPAETLGVAELL